jgi:hypothetical protein
LVGDVAGRYPCQSVQMSGHGLAGRFGIQHEPRVAVRRLKTPLPRPLGRDRSGFGRIIRYGGQGTTQFSCCSSASAGFGAW